MPIPSYEATFAYLSEQSYNGGMEPYYDALRLLVALVQHAEGLPTKEQLVELAYHLNDEQRHQLRQLATAASRLDDTAIAAEIGEEQYHAQKARHFGTDNPEQMDVPFWRLMVRRGWNAYQARMQYDRAYRQYMQAYSARREREEAGEAVPAELELPHPGYGPPIWCFQRFGMSLTRLPDGRAVFIAGEHEDFYDPDFCIYNDVIVLDPDLRVTIYGYPREVFPPTDFHSATLVGESDLYIIGNLGYPEERRPGETPVYRLDTTTMQMSRVETAGAMPGWLSRHEAVFDPACNAIKVTGGQVFRTRNGKQTLKASRRSYWLSLDTAMWSLRKPLRRSPEQR
jgi:hypothetical protein